MNEQMDQRSRQRAPMPAQIEAGKIYTLRQVAWLCFRHGANWLTANLPTLMADHGFPPPIVPFGQKRWRGEDLLNWQATSQQNRAFALPGYNDRLVAERTGRARPAKRTKKP